MLGSYFLPADNQQYLSLFKTWILPVVELSILVIVIGKVRKVIRQLGSVQHSTPDFFDAVKVVCKELLPKKLIYPIAMEVAVFYYGFVKWGTRDTSENEFTYHRKSGGIPLLIALIFVILAETFVFHFLLMRWSEVAAWILSGISIYTGIQVFGIAKSMVQRPIRIEEDKLILRYGIVNEAHISFREIESIELSTKSIESDERIRNLSFLGALESHNVILYLKSEQILIGLYGVKKKFHTLTMHIDNAIAFKEMVSRHAN